MNIELSDDKKTLISAKDISARFVVPHCVTEIAPGAFRNCNELRTIDFPLSVQKIGDEAFFGCKNLTNVFIRYSSVSEIGDRAFQLCENLKSIHFPDTLHKIGSCVFSVRIAL